MTAEPVEPVGVGSDDRCGDDGDEAPPVGTVGQELALLLQLVAERSSLRHPVVTVVREHPEVVEQAADSVVGWLRDLQDTVAQATSGVRR